MQSHNGPRAEAFVTPTLAERRAHFTDDEETPTVRLPRTTLPTEEMPTLPLTRVERPTDPHTQMPTLELAPVEIDAIVQGADVVTVAPEGQGDTRTVENVRLARGSSELLPTASPATPSARGPRRPRETLRADAVRLEPGAPTPPPRKR